MTGKESEKWFDKTKTGAWHRSEHHRQRREEEEDFYNLKEFEGYDERPYFPPEAPLRIKISRFFNRIVKRIAKLFA